MRVIGFAGWSGAGKTTLITRLIPLLTGRGLEVAALKHAHHSFEVDRPGKDSYEFRAAGAREVLVVSARRWAQMHELSEETEPTLAVLLQRLSPCDLVLIEGYKALPIPRIEVRRKGITAAPIEGVSARICDEPVSDGTPTLAFDDYAGIIATVLRLAGLNRLERESGAGNRKST